MWYVLYCVLYLLRSLWYRNACCKQDFIFGYSEWRPHPKGLPLLMVKITGGLASLSLWYWCSGVTRSRIWKQIIVTVAHFFVHEVHWTNPLWHTEFRILTLFFSSHQKAHNNNKSSPSISPSATIWAHSICQRTYKSSWFRSWGTPPTNTWQWQLGVPSWERTTFTRGRSMKCNDIGKPTEIKYDKTCDLEMVWCDMMRHDVTDCDFLAQQPTFCSHQHTLRSWAMLTTYRSFGQAGNTPLNSAEAKVSQTKQDKTKPTSVLNRESPGKT